MNTILFSSRSFAQPTTKSLPTRPSVNMSPATSIASAPLAREIQDSDHACRQEGLSISLDIHGRWVPGLLQPGEPRDKLQQRRLILGRNYQSYREKISNGAGHPRSGPGQPADGLYAHHLHTTRDPKGQPWHWHTDSITNRSVTLLCAPQPCSLCGHHLHSAPGATIRPRANSRPGSPERAA